MQPDSGVTLLELLRRVPATQTMPVVCTADRWLLTRYKEQSHALGCAVVLKPFDLDVLLRTVQARITTAAVIDVGV
jgi:hypothetical protein